MQESASLAVWHSLASLWHSVQSCWLVGWRMLNSRLTYQIISVGVFFAFFAAYVALLGLRKLHLAARCQLLSRHHGCWTLLEEPRQSLLACTCPHYKVLTSQKCTPQINLKLQQDRKQETLAASRIASNRILTWFGSWQCVLWLFRLKWRGFHAFAFGNIWRRQSLRSWSLPVRSRPFAWASLPPCLCKAAAVTMLTPYLQREIPTRPQSLSQWPKQWQWRLPPLWLLRSLMDRRLWRSTTKPHGWVDPLSAIVTAELGSGPECHTFA